MSIKIFRPELVATFEKMIKGVNVELSEKGKAELKGIIKGRWVFIIEMTCDETITIQDNTHMQMSGITIDYIKV